MSNRTIFRFETDLTAACVSIRLGASKHNVKMTVQQAKDTVLYKALVDLQTSYQRLQTASFRFYSDLNETKEGFDALKDIFKELALTRDAAGFAKYVSPMNADSNESSYKIALRHVCMATSCMEFVDMLLSSSGSIPAYGNAVPHYLQVSLEKAKCRKMALEVQAMNSSFTAGTPTQRQLFSTSPRDLKQSSTATDDDYRVVAQYRKVMKVTPFTGRKTPQHLKAKNSKDKGCLLCHSCVSDNDQGSHYHFDCPEYSKAKVDELKEMILECVDRPENIQAIKDANLKVSDVKHALSVCFN